MKFLGLILLLLSHVYGLDANEEYENTNLNIETISIETNPTISVISSNDEREEVKEVKQPTVLPLKTVEVWLPSSKDETSELPTIDCPLCLTEYEVVIGKNLHKRHNVPEYNEMLNHPDFLHKTWESCPECGTIYCGCSTVQLNSCAWCRKVFNPRPNQSNIRTSGGRVYPLGFNPLFRTSNVDYMGYSYHNTWLR